MNFSIHVSNRETIQESVWRPAIGKAKTEDLLICMASLRNHKPLNVGGIYVKSLISSKNIYEEFLMCWAVFQDLNNDELIDKIPLLTNMYVLYLFEINIHKHKYQLIITDMKKNETAQEAGVWGGEAPW